METETRTLIQRISDIVRDAGPNGIPTKHIGKVVGFPVGCSVKRAERLGKIRSIKTQWGPRWFPAISTTDADKVSDALGKPGDVPPGYDRSDWSA